MKLYSYWRKFNEELAVRVVLAVATMECVYAFTAFVLIPLFLPVTMPFVQYTSSAVLQLTFLPLIMVGQDVMSRRERAQRDADHRTLISEMKILREVHAAVVKDNKDVDNAA